MPPTGEVPTPQLAHELRNTLGRLVRRLRAEPGLPVGRITVLGRLDREGPASISDLAAGENMRPQSMAQTVDDLQESGYVTRRPDPSDRRRTFIELTPQGLEVLSAQRARRESWVTEALDRELSARERKELRAALRLLERVADC